MVNLKLKLITKFKFFGTILAIKLGNAVGDSQQTPPRSSHSLPDVSEAIDAFNGGLLPRSIPPSSPNSGLVAKSFPQHHHHHAGFQPRANKDFYEVPTGQSDPVASGPPPSQSLITSPKSPRFKDVDNDSFVARSNQFPRLMTESFTTNTMPKAVANPPLFTNTESNIGVNLYKAPILASVIANTQQTVRPTTQSPRATPSPTTNKITLTTIINPVTSTTRITTIVPSTVPTTTTTMTPTTTSTRAALFLPSTTTPGSITTPIMTKETINLYKESKETFTLKTTFSPSTIAQTVSKIQSTTTSSNPTKIVSTTLKPTDATTTTLAINLYKAQNNTLPPVPTTTPMRSSSQMLTTSNIPRTIVPSTFFASSTLANLIPSTQSVTVPATTKINPIPSVAPTHIPDIKITTAGPFTKQTYLPLVTTQESTVSHNPIIASTSEQGINFYKANSTSQTNPLWRTTVESLTTPTTPVMTSMRTTPQTSGAQNNISLYSNTGTTMGFTLFALKGTSTTTTTSTEASVTTKNQGILQSSIMSTRLGIPTVPSTTTTRIPVERTPTTKITMITPNEMSTSSTTTPHVTTTKTTPIIINTNSSTPRIGTTIFTTEQGVNLYNVKEGADITTTPEIGSSSTKVGKATTTMVTPPPSTTTKIEGMSITTTTTSSTTAPTTTPTSSTVETEPTPDTTLSATEEGINLYNEKFTRSNVKISSTTTLTTMTKIQTTITTTQTTTTFTSETAPPITSTTLSDTTLEQDINLYNDPGTSKSLETSSAMTTTTEVPSTTTTEVPSTTTTSRPTTSPVLSTTTFAPITIMMTTLLFVLGPGSRAVPDILDDRTLTITQYHQATSLAAKTKSDYDLEEWDEKLAWRMMFGDPKHPWPMDTWPYNSYCEKQNKITAETETKFYNSLYPDNKIVHKVGKIFAEDGEAYMKQFCDPGSYRYGAYVTQKGMAASIGARMSKMHRDALVEILMDMSMNPDKEDMNLLICTLKAWASRTECLYPDDYDVRDIISSFLTSTFRKITKLLEEETKTTSLRNCQLDLFKKPEEKPPKSVQLLVLKAVNSLTKN